LSVLGDVPCGSCRACCRHDLIPLIPEGGDLVWAYQHDVIATSAGPAAFLRCATNGDCIYLGRDGCTIHGRAPAVCKAFDCRYLVHGKTGAELRAMINSGMASKTILSAGRERLETLDLP
jgi:Fe-S-cluster containining protein